MRFALFVVLILFNTSPAYACIFSHNLEQTMQMRDYVFLGKVTACGSAESEVIKVKALKIWKGDVREEYLLQGSCETGVLRHGKKYLIIADTKTDSDLLDISRKFCETNTHEIMPVWKRNIMGAWYSFYMGRYDFIIPSLFDTRELFKGLGEPVHSFE